MTDSIAAIKEKLDRALNCIQEIKGLKQKQSCLEEKIKAEVNMNRFEIWSDIKKEIVRIKMGWKHYQTVDPRKREPRLLGDCLVSVY